MMWSIQRDTGLAGSQHVGQTFRTKAFAENLHSIFNRSDLNRSLQKAISEVLKMTRPTFHVAMMGPKRRVNLYSRQREGKREASRICYGTDAVQLPFKSTMSYLRGWRGEVWPASCIAGRIVSFWEEVDRKP